MATTNSTPSWLLPPPVRRFREHLREIRRVAGETHWHVVEARARQDEQLAELAAVVHDQRSALAQVEAQVQQLAGQTATQHAQLLEALRVIHSRGPWRRERLRELRADPSYERPYTHPDPLVSVVIAAYDNHRSLRERAIPSVLAQTYQNFEVVVVADAASDEARIAVESFRDPRFSFFNLPYRGPYPAEPHAAWLVSRAPPTNEAIRRARGLWIAPLADDDAFRPHHIERLLDCARRDRLELAYGKLEAYFADGQQTTIGCFPPRLGQFGVQAAIYHAGLADIFEYELADAAFGLPEDWGFCLRTMEAGVRIGMFDEVTVDIYPSRNWALRWEGGWIGPPPEPESHDARTDQLASGADNRLEALDACVRDQVHALADIEARLDARASTKRGGGFIPASAKPVTVLAGTRVTPRSADSRADSPLLTVITTTYNQEPYVADAIESVIAQQTSFPIHLILTDDASTDSTPEIIERFRAQFPERITVLRSERNGGYFANGLRALALTNTDYFTLLDADDYWTDETYLQRAVDFLEGHPEFVIYSANCFCEHPDGSRNLFISGDAPDDEFCFEDYLQKRAIPTQTTGTIFRNVFFNSGVPEVFADMLGSDDQYSFACDIDRYAIHLEKGKARFENRAVGVYRITGHGIYTGTNQLERSFWEARAKLDHYRYFGCRHPEFFLSEAVGWTARCLEIMREVASGANTEIEITAGQVGDIRRVVEECRSQLASLVYDHAYYARHREGSARAAETILPIAFDLVRPASVIDVGCGIGTWLAAASRLGAIQVLGIDGPWVSRDSLAIQAESFLEHDLETPLPRERQFDLAICVEVAEHLDPARGDSLIEDLCDLADVVVFSAAIPGQTGEGHRNEQWPAYWRGRFARRKYALVDCFRPTLWGDDQVEYWYVQNTFLYVSLDRLHADQRLRAAADEAPHMPLSVVHPRLLEALSPPRTPPDPEPQLAAWSPIDANVELS